MTMDREKEREIELESAMYTNCLLLGLDPNIFGVGSNTGAPRVGLFRHSNPKLGEQLLYFILSSLRGPAQSARDFDKVWPIFDSAQSRDFRKVVQGIISELESQGALPRSNSRVSSLATCCGPRFVELLWQLSLHALREVHRRTFATDVASNPLPAPLTDVAFTHAATLLPVTKARIALERRKFLKNAETAVQRQAMWSDLAHEMTAEFRGLCAEEAYLQQELEKLHELRNKVKLEGELWDELVSSSSQNSHIVQRATRLWDSLLSRKSQHEVLASGPIEDLIAHREHRYRISGSSLLAAMDQSSLVSSSNTSPHFDNEEKESSQEELNKESTSKLELSLTNENEEKYSRLDEKNIRGQPTVDIAEILRRWTHALQRIHKQSLQLAKANDGEGPELLRSVHDGSTSSHAESLAATLTEHRQHLDSIQVLINQLKDVAPTIQNSITELTEEVNTISSNLRPDMKIRSNSPVQAQHSGRTLESGTDEVELSSRLSSVQLEKVSASPPALKLPQLFSSTPSSSGKTGNTQKRQIVAEMEKKIVDQPPSNSHIDNSTLDEDFLFLQNLKRSVREAALTSQQCNMESSQDSHSNEYSEHFFVPLSGTGFSRHSQDKKHNSLKSKQLFTSQTDSPLLQTPARDNDLRSKHAVTDMSNEFDSLSEFGASFSVSDIHMSFYGLDEAQGQIFSPPLLMDAALLGDSYEDLLAPLSDTETALMKY
ncbi:AUGMIN subunit 6 [Castilleja foliolosa]|uniref:AUGMIN subunit 6 n=1 Tax=Castilleja foliolosa TaxID=1961234 RepID=A0ABD3C671_9LAMI